MMIKFRCPAVLYCLIAKETLDRMNADGFVQFSTVAGILAGVIADPAHDARQRVVFH